MGAEPSTAQRIQNARLRLRLTNKELERDAGKARSEIETLRRRVRIAILAGHDKSSVRELASSVVQQESLARSLEASARRIAAVERRLRQAVALRRVNTALITAASSMRLIEEAVPIDELTTVLEAFERSSENAEVHAAYVDESLQSSMRSMTPDASVDAVLSSVGDECALEVSALLSTASAAPRRQPDAPLPNLPTVPQHEF